MAAQQDKSRPILAISFLNDSSNIGPKKFRFQPWSNRFREQLSIWRLRLSLELLSILLILPLPLFGQRVGAGIVRFLVSRPPPKVVVLAVFVLL